MKRCQFYPRYDDSFGISYFQVMIIKAISIFKIEFFVYFKIAAIGEHVTLPCRVVNKLGTMQWTRDDFGLGTDRNLTGFKRYKMTGSDEEGRTLFFYKS